MHGRRSTKSCGPCRKAKLGCDALRQTGSRCTNCERRGKVCHPQGSGSIRPGVRPFHTSRPQPLLSSHDVATGDASAFHTLPSPPLSASDIATVANRRMQAKVFHDILWDIYVSIFECRFAIWLGHSCLPYPAISAGTKVSVAWLALRLDRGAGLASATRPSTNNHDATLNDALRLAVYAYASRWLPLQSALTSSNTYELEEARSQQRNVRAQLWDRARRAMCPLLSRPSYRSILAMFLFTLTDVPADAADPGFPQVCSQIILGHFNVLRSPLGQLGVYPSYQNQTTMLKPSDATQAPTLIEGPVDEAERNLQDAIFWIGVVCDTGRSLIHQLPSVILPGTSGDKKVWEFIRQRTVIFDQSFRGLHETPLPLEPGILTVVFQHATACKTMYLGVLAQYCGALFHDTLDRDEAAKRVLTESRRFHQVFDPLLTLCARDFFSLNRENRLHYVLLMAHYHMGTLILADVLEKIGLKQECLNDPLLSRIRACHAVVNALSLLFAYDSCTNDSTSYGSTLLHDPSPELMVEVLARAGNAICVELEASRFSPSTAQTMLGVIDKALRILSQTSDTAARALSSLRQQYSSHDLHVKFDVHFLPVKVQDDHIALLSSCNDAFIDNFLTEAQAKSELDQNYLETIIQRRVDSATGSILQP